MYQFMWEDIQKLIEKFIEGRVSLFFLLLFGTGLVLLILATRMFIKIKRIDLLFNGDKKERTSLADELYLGIYNKSGETLQKSSLMDDAMGCLVVGIVITGLSFVFFVELFGVLLQVLVLLVIPALMVVLMLGLILAGIKGVKDINTQLDKLEKRAMEEKRKVLIEDELEK